MVDPSPRGMPLQLQRYWLAGKGAAKIRWNVPGDFLRCVRQLTKYFPKDPKGLCNILHTKATGGPPGHGSLESHHHSLTASMVGGYGDLEALTAAQALLDRQPKMGQYAWAGPLAPIGRPTGEPRRTRVFEPGSLSHRVLPLPLDARLMQGNGHEGAMTVGRILGITYGPDDKGLEFAWGYGDYLDEDIVPEAKRARYLAEMGVSGPSVDPGGRVNVTVNPETGFEHMLQFVIGGTTLVSIPAFAALRQMVFETDGDWPEDDPDMVMDMGPEEDCGCGHSAPVKATAKAVGYSGDDDHVFVVNTSGWRGLPLAPRDSVFDNDDAVKRITAWANGGQDTEKMRRSFMYYDASKPPTDPTSYRLPLGDIINGRLTLIFHAVYAAAALLSGAHGGLPDVPETEIAQIRNVISDIYPEMATAFNDQSIRAPWDRSAKEGVQLSMDEYASGAAQPYGDVAYADPGYRDSKKRYPIDTPEHIRAAWSYINQADNASFYKPEQLKLIKARIMAAAKKHGVEISDQASITASMSDDGYMLTPPREWFEDPKLPKGFRLSVDNNGRVKGRLAEWGVCHRDVAMRECVLAPRSQQGYAPFHLGEVVTAEGDVLTVGKIVMDTRHANINLGYASAALHYDNTGDEIAVVRAGEDEYGIWVAGAVVPEATPKKVAKLRRSPLSGDWRREKGSLELTAALAVNAPAFPVYSMESDEQLALVAAGSVWIEEAEEMDEPFVPPTGIVEALTASVTAQLDEADRDELAARLQDILDDEEIYAQRERAARLESVLSRD